LARDCDAENYNETIDVGKCHEYKTAMIDKANESLVSTWQPWP